MNTKTVSVTAALAAGMLARVLTASPALADGWYTFKGQGKIDKYERLYVREQGKRVTVYWLKRYTDAPPVCFTGKQSKPRNTYTGRYRFTDPYSDKAISKATTFQFRRSGSGSGGSATFNSLLPFVGGGGYFKGRSFTGAPSGSAWCFR